MAFHHDGLYWDNLAEAQAELAKHPEAVLLWCDEDENWESWDDQSTGWFSITDESGERCLDDEGNWLYVA